MADEETRKATVMKVFVQSRDAYVGRNIARAVARRREILKKLEDGGESKPADEDDERVPNTVELLESIANEGSRSEHLRIADAIVLNLFDDIDEAKQIIREIRALTLVRPKILICVSSLMTWSHTKFTDEAKLDEANFKQRQSPAELSEQRLIETITINSNQELLTTFVASAGMIFGEGESIFHSLFKTAWLAEQPILHFIGEGNNILPTIHISDLSMIVVRMLEKPPLSTKYIVACDKSSTKQRDIVQAVAQTLGNAQVGFIDPLDPKADKSSWFSANMAFKDERYVLTKLASFQWVAPDGIVPVINTVVDEYIKVRNLRPIRTLMLGPPGSGKSHYASKLAKKYYLTHLQTHDIVKRAQDQGDELAHEMRAALAASKKDPKIPDALIAKAVRIELKRPIIRNKGYILDGYPLSLEQSKLVFNMTKDKLPWLADAVAADIDGEPAADEGDQPTANLDSTTAPGLAIVLRSTKEQSINRLQDLSEEQIIQGHNDVTSFERRWKEYAATNGTDSETSPLVLFSQLEVCELDGSNESETLDSMSLYLESGGKPFNYHPTEEEEAALLAAIEQSKRDELEKKEAIRAKEKAIHEEEMKLRELKQAEYADKLASIAIQEKELLEGRAKPLRSYLMENVMPAVSEGLVELSKFQPDDPIDFLAEFLIKKSIEKEQAGRTVNATH